MNGNAIAGNCSIDAGRDMEWAHVGEGGFAIRWCWCGGGFAGGRCRGDLTSGHFPVPFPTRN